MLALIDTFLKRTALALEMHTQLPWATGVTRVFHNFPTLAGKLKLVKFIHLKQLLVGMNKEKIE